jgi:hypothetical protein
MCETNLGPETLALLEQVNTFFENIYRTPRRLSSILRTQGMREEDITRLAQNHLDAYLTKFLGHCTTWMAKMLSERHCDILVRYYGLDRKPKTTLTALAKKYGVSRERVRQLRGSAFRRLAHRAHKQQLGQMALAAAQMFLYPNDIATNSELEDLLSPTPRPLGTKRIRRDSPANAGQPWTKEEEQHLVAGYKAGDSIEDLSTKHQRTPVAIRSRLARIDAIERVGWAKRSETRRGVAGAEEVEL